MADITELAQSLKAAANKAGSDDWQAKKISGDFYVIRKGSYSSRCGYTTYQPIAEIDHKPTRDYVAIASPANILALVEALEKAQRYTEELREWNAGLAQESFECQQRVAELAAENVALKSFVGECEIAHGEGNWTSDVEKTVYVPATEWMPPAPATDRIVAGIKADGVEEFVSNTVHKISDESGAVSALAYLSLANSHVKQLREGAE